MHWPRLKISYNKPLITVLIPVYNAEKFIFETITSILNQSYRNLEILIADDCSTDNSKRILDKFIDKRIKRFDNNINIGYLKTVNSLFNQANGQLITFQDADDFSKIYRIERQLNEFKKDLNLGLCGSFIEYINEKGKALEKRDYPVRTNEIYDYYQLNNPFCGATIMFRAEILKEIGGYRPFFDRIGNEDYDWASLIIEKYKSKNVPEYLYKVRKSRNSISRSINNHEQLLSSEYVKFFISERKQFGLDFLQGNKESSFLKFRAKCFLPYINDKSLIKRKDIDVKYYNGLKKELIIPSIQAIIIQPKKIINYKYFLFSLYQFLISLIEKRK